MQLKDIFNLLIEVEQRFDVNSLRWSSFKLWPLLRYVLWTELQYSNRNRPLKTGNQKSVLGRSVTLTAKAIAYAISRYNNQIKKDSDVERIFISRPVYLQQLPTGEMFDRIVDPLLYISDSKIACQKYYIGNFQHAMLKYPASRLMPSLRTGPLLSDHDAIINDIADLVGLEHGVLKKQYLHAFDKFSRWHNTGVELFEKTCGVKEVLVTSWYVPDMMGICAAASSMDIPIIDIQHGKQGRYQGMYSGWSQIQEEGYELMPYSFWCWGQPSCDHITRYSPDRKKHRPFIGGFPWLDYYKQFVAAAPAKYRQQGSKKPMVVLVTTQPREGLKGEPIPDFIIKYLQENKSSDTHFIFRCHPNDNNGPEYCRHRLVDIGQDLYSIDDGKENLYDRLLHCDLHITAYSSCCYEAEAFGIPTILFGGDAQDIYGEEIASGRFGWVADDIHTNLSEIIKPGFNEAVSGNNSPYIVADMSFSRDVLEKLNLYTGSDLYR